MLALNGDCVRKVVLMLADSEQLRENIIKEVWEGKGHAVMLQAKTARDLSSAEELSSRGYLCAVTGFYCCLLFCCCMERERDN